MSTSHTTPQTIEVKPPSLRREGRTIARVAWVVAALAYGAILLRRANGAENGGGNLLAHQIRFADLESKDQRMVLALQEGLTEAENIRATNLVWSSTTALAARGVPPFAPDPIGKDAYRWQFQREKDVVTYLGSPKEGGQAGSSSSAFLLRIVELSDEEPEVEQSTSGRTRLGDGTNVEVSLWVRAGSDAPLHINASPRNQGWTQIVFESKPTEK